jgi:RHS repeat-associated protein
VLRYAGYCYDSESGLYYLSARHYDPATRQFLSKDLSRNDGEQSAYQYCLGNPVGGTDPTGYRVLRDDKQKSPAELAWLHNRVNEELARRNIEARRSTAVKAWETAANYLSPIGWLGMLVHKMDKDYGYVYDFAMGTGAHERYFGASSGEAQEMMRSANVVRSWAAYKEGGYKDIPFYYDSWVAKHETIDLSGVDTPWLLFSNTPSVAGGYLGASIHNNEDGTSTVTIPNDGGAKSAFLHIPPDSPIDWFYFRTIHNTYEWTWPNDYDSYAD